MCRRERRWPHRIVGGEKASDQAEQLVFGNGLGEDGYGA
jgi:hypothetical protein